MERGSNVAAWREEFEYAKSAELLTRCPVCTHAMGLLDPFATDCERTCGLCGFALANRGGIWRALAPGRERHFGQFMREYSQVRAREGRGSSSPEYYLALPYADANGRNGWQWKIRAVTFRYFLRRILPAFERRWMRPLEILDLGAGNGWLSYRLAQRGHLPVAIDLLDNGEDGLGAARHYYSGLGWMFPRFQAEMDRLPFAGGQFDAAVFNASFHYSTDYCATAAEALRCLRPGGHVVILDSPFYRRAGSGQQMLEERKNRFMQTFGFASDSIPSREFLTAGALEEMSFRLRLRWKVCRPWYGWRWALRPLKAGLMGRREPSKFHIFWAEVGG